MVLIQEKTKGEKQFIFLASIRAEGNIARGCRAVEMSRSTIRQWRQNEVFERDFRDAMDEYIDDMEHDADVRAKGWDEVREDGSVIRKHSDVMMIFKLKGYRPEVYRDNYKGTGAADLPEQGTTQRISDVYKAYLAKEESYEQPDI